MAARSRSRSGDEEPGERRHARGTNPKAELCVGRAAIQPQAPLRAEELQAVHGIDHRLLLGRASEGGVERSSASTISNALAPSGS